MVSGYNMTGCHTPAGGALECSTLEMLRHYSLCVAKSTAVAVAVLPGAHEVATAACIAHVGQRSCRRAVAAVRSMSCMCRAL